MNKEFKYNNINYLVMGVVFLGIGISYITFYILLINSRAYKTGATLIFLFCALFFVISGAFYLNLYKANAIRIDANGLCIYRGVILSKIIVKYVDVKVARVFGNSLRMGLKDGSEVSIRLNELSIHNVDELFIRLEENLDSIVIKKNSIFDR